MKFTLKDVKSPYILIEQFNTRCPHCMHQAPILNELYNKVQQDAALKGKVKFMSVGQGNDEMQVKAWKVIQKVPFPVIPDPDSTLGKALNFTPYPVSMVVDKSGKILWVHVGAFDTADEALKGIKAVREVKTAIIIPRSRGQASSGYPVVVCPLPSHLTSAYFPALTLIVFSYYFH